MNGRVRVRSLEGHGLHIRVPAYLRGKTGVIERRLGPFQNPELLAYRQRGAALALYRVRFTMAEVWGDGAENAADTLEAEIYEHWLEPLEHGHAA